MSETLIHFPLYIGDALKRFIEYPTLQQRGAWVSIIVALVQNNGILPDDETIYYKCLAFNEQDKQVLQQVLSKCLSKTEKGWVDDNTTILINNQKILREKRRIAGQVGGKSKQIKQANAIASATVLLKQSESESESESKTELVKKKEGKNFVLPLPEWLPLDDWNDYLDARNKRGKKATNRAKQLVIIKLHELRTSGNDPGAVLRESIVNGWTGVFKLKEQNNGNKTGFAGEYRNNDDSKKARMDSNRGKLMSAIFNA
jgi:uncharacterized protein YdaU (DUF1376 family)